MLKIVKLVKDFILLLVSFIVTEETNEKLPRDSIFAVASTEVLIIEAIYDI